jgi:glycyl-tRNA synthetase
LLAAYNTAAERLDISANVDAFLTAFAPVVPVIQRYFEGVMVHTDNRKVRQNRLGLLQAIAALAHGRADLSQLAGF